jgi:SsrA-binding protein
MAKTNEEKTVAVNRKARYEYHIEETYEAGLLLEGSEVKSLRVGNVSLQDAFARPEKNEIWLYNLHITPWDKGSHFKPDPKRKRKLLLRKPEIRRLIGKVSEKGYALIPLRVYFKGRWAKLELALAKGKKLYDKRQAIREKEAKREMERVFHARGF